MISTRTKMIILRATLLGKLALVSLVTFASQASYAQPPRPLITGGWSEATIDGDTYAIAAFALPKLKQGIARIKSIDQAEQQVVAGTNYRLEMTLTNRTRWRVTVWRMLDGQLKLTKTQRLPPTAH